MRTAVATLAVILVLSTALAPKTTRKMTDFEVMWRVGTRAAAAQPLNQPQDGHYKWKYLPASAMLMIPIAALPLHAAKIVWFYIVVAALAALVWWSIAALPDRRRSPAALAVLTTIAMAKFYAHELTLGQINALMAVAALAAVRFDRIGQPIAAGTLFGASILLKPYTIVFLGYLAWTRRFATALVVAAFLACAVAVPAVLYGWHGNLALLSDWLRVLADSTPAALLYQDSVSVWAMYAKWFGPSPVATWSAVATSVALAALVAYMSAARPPTPTGRYLDVALLLLLTPLWSPQGWDYGLLVGTPAVVAVVDRLDDLPRPLAILTAFAIATIAFSVYDVMGRQFYAAFMSSAAITVCALVVVAATAWLRLHDGREAVAGRLAEEIQSSGGSTPDRPRLPDVIETARSSRR